MACAPGTVFARHRRKSFNRFVLSLAWLTGCAGASAQSLFISEDNPGADQIVVSASRVPTPLNETGSAVSIISKDDLAAGQYVFLADALRDAAGAAVNSNGGAGAATSVRLRGASSGQTLVAIDGVIVNDPSAPQGGFNFASLTSDDIERVEILRGPQSLLYGADAIGGVISITTSARKEISLQTEAGAYGALRAGAAAGFGDKENHARFAASFSRADGFSRAANGTERDGHRLYALSFTGGATLSPEWRAMATVRASDAKAGIDGFPAPDFTLGDTNDIEKSRSLLASARLVQKRAHYEGTLSLTQSLIDRGTWNETTQSFSAKGDRTALEYLAVMEPGEALRIIGGAKGERLSARVSGVDEDARNGAVFLLAEARPADGVIVSGGVRRSEYSTTRGATTARAAVSWTPDKRLHLRASWGQGFRAPSLFELHYDQFGVTPNPDLRPERAEGFDAGADITMEGAIKGTISATVYRTRTTDQIDFSLYENGYFNIAETRARGVEIESAFSLSDTLTMTARYTFTDAIDLSTGAELARQSKHKAGASLSYQATPDLALAAAATYDGKENDAPTDNEAYTRIDLRAAYSLTATLEIYARIENLLDKRYQDVSGYAEPGASLYAGVRARL